MDTTQTTTKRLHRTSRGAMIGGVCAGLGEYFAVDPTLIRVIFIVLALIAGHGILLYIILWLLLPNE